MAGDRRDARRVCRDTRSSRAPLLAEREPEDILVHTIPSRTAVVVRGGGLAGRMPGLDAVKGSAPPTYAAGSSIAATSYRGAARRTSARPASATAPDAVRPAPRKLIRRLSAQNEAAVDCQRLAGEGCSIVAREHGHHSGGVIGGERSRQRLVRLGVGELGCRDAGGGGRVRQARARRR